MAFTNGVYDFKNFKFREGMPDDYISKSTNKPRPQKIGENIAIDTISVNRIIFIFFIITFPS